MTDAQNSAPVGPGRPPKEYQFKPGQPSPNPGGRPKQVRELLDLARRAVPQALALAMKFIVDEKEDSRVRLEAAKFITSYGLGTPPREPHPDALESMSDEELRQEILERLSGELASRPSAS